MGNVPIKIRVVRDGHHETVVVKRFSLQTKFERLLEYTSRPPFGPWSDYHAECKHVYINRKNGGLFKIDPIGAFRDQTLHM